MAGQPGEAAALALKAYRDEPAWPPNQQFARVLAERGVIPRLADMIASADFEDRVDALRGLHHDLHRQGRYTDAVTVGTVAMKVEPSPLSAYNVACSAARAGDREVAVASLQRAVTLGFDDWSMATSDEDFADIRHDRRWTEIASIVRHSGAVESSPPPMS